MKKTILTLVTLISCAAWSADTSTVDVNKGCRGIYKSASEELLKAIESFHDGVTSAQQLGVISAGISSGVVSARTLCVAIESPKARKCSDRFKAVYTDIRSNVSSGALIFGNQTDVKAGRLYIAATRLKLNVIDSTCW